MVSNFKQNTVQWRKFKTVGQIHFFCPNMPNLLCHPRCMCFLWELHCSMSSHLRDHQGFTHQQRPSLCLIFIVKKKPIRKNKYVVLLALSCRLLRSVSTVTCVVVLIVAIVVIVVTAIVRIRVSISRIIAAISRIIIAVSVVGRRIVGA